MGRGEALSYAFPSFVVDVQYDTCKYSGKEGNSISLEFRGEYGLGVKLESLHLCSKKGLGIEMFQGKKKLK